MINVIFTEPVIQRRRSLRRILNIPRQTYGFATVIRQEYKFVSCLQAWKVSPTIGVSFMKYSRNRWLYLIDIIIVIILGLTVRGLGELLPDFLDKYSGDVLWGLMVYFVIAFILNKRDIISISILAFLFAAAVEASQLYHAPWIDAIRSNRLGGLILGYGFLWSDIICYAVGIALGALIELKLFSGKPKRWIN
jgi:hypothetical protein